MKPEPLLARTAFFRPCFRSLLCAFLLLLAPREAPAQDPYKELELVRPKRIQAARNFTVPTLDGKTFRLADYKGKVVFLNFWATWCPPCREEMPAMERLYQRYKDKGFVILGVSVDAEGASVVIPFVKEHKLTFLIGFDPKMTLADQYGVRALPSTFLIDKRGGLVATALGPREWNGTAAYSLMELLLK